MLLLIGVISALAHYNYTTQRQVFLHQINSDTADMAQAVRYSIEKFHATEQTLSLHQLVKNISLDLDIFEFRYLDARGVTIGSMFDEEIERPFLRTEVERLLSTPDGEGRFYEEVRDFTQVLAIAHPVRHDGQLVGIIDLAVDISSFRYQNPATQLALRRQKQADIRNLLTAISGSVNNSLQVIESVNIDNFLLHLVNGSQSVREIEIIDTDGRVVASSGQLAVGTRLTSDQIGREGIIQAPEGAVLRMKLPLQTPINGGSTLILVSDATTYVKNEQSLSHNLWATALLVMSLSIAITWSVYRINLERTRSENSRLEAIVRERTNEIERLSKIDKLTGLANRSALDADLEREFRRALRYSHPLTMLVLDLDHFKRVNDTFGHLGGDEVLRAIGERLRKQLRETDVVGRYGGEEFVILLPETELAAALNIAEELRRQIEQEKVAFGDIDIAMTASIGVARLEAGVQDCKELFAHADSALYHAKHSGRNRISCMDSGQVRPAQVASF
ncbi:MAG TPA: GGDEF domain-containing protein [Gammaproteobacteria bacterium]